MSPARFKRNYIRYLTVFFVVGLAAGLVISIPCGHTTGDFDVYCAAGRNFLARAPIYIPHAGIEEFKYSPVFALLFAPFAMLQKASALYLWGTMNILLLYFIFYLFYKLKQMSFNRPKDFFLIFCLLALSGRYIFSSIKIGQVNILLCFFLVLTVYFELNKKYLWAGVSLAFCLMIKLFPLLMLGYFILRRRFKIVASTVFAAAVFLLVPALYSGFGLNLEYLHGWVSLLRSTPAPMFYSVKNYSLFAFFSWLFVSRHEHLFVLDYRYISAKLTPAVYYAWATSCLVLFSLFFHGSFSKKERGIELVYLDYACLFVCMLLFNPLAYLNALVFLIVPYFIILRALFYWELGKKCSWAVGGLVSASFITSMAYNKVFFCDIKQFYQFLRFRLPFFTLLLAYLILLLIKFCLKIKLKKHAAPVSG